MKNIREDVIEWISSLSGFQGGNPSAEIWVCGLEFQEDSNNFKILFKDNEYPFVKTPISESEIKTHIEENFKNEPFNLKIKLLLETYYGNGVINEKDIFTKSGKVFKLNLFPLGQASTGEAYPENSNHGIKSKSELRTISIHNGRFDKFKKLLNKNKKHVKAIVCCSRGELDTFVRAFENEENYHSRIKELLENRKEIMPGSGKYMNHCKLSTGQYLFVVPFLSGRASSLTNEKLVEFVKKMKKII